MRTTIRGELSGLGKDLALSDVRLAAVRVLSGRPITPEQMEAAGLLSRMLVSELAILESGVKVPEAAVPREEMRRQIELMLRGLSGARIDEPILKKDAAVLRQLVAMLQPLAEGQLSTAQAEGLLQTLHELMVTPAEVPEPPEPNQGRELDG